MLNKAYYTKTLLIAISFGTIATIISGSALAGFEWVPKTSQSSAKTANEKIQVQQAPVPEVTSEHASEIIHVPSQSVESEAAAPSAAPDIMTPSPFDTIAAPAPKAEPQPVINTIDFTNTASKQKTEDYNIEPTEPIKAQSLNAEEETVTLSTTATATPNDQTPEDLQAKNSADNIIPMANQPQQLAPPRPKQEKTAQPLVISTYPENPTKPALANNRSPVTEANYAEAVGFGKDMPMALAVQQILPEDYAYSFAKSVNPGARVSWNGGKQWNLVLLETLEPLGLSARIEGKNVVIVPSSEDLSAAETNMSEQADKQAADDVLSIEPASGTEAKPDINKKIISNRLIIRDPGEQETEQPGLSKSALLKPAPKQESSLSVPSLENANTGNENNRSEQNTSAGSQHVWKAYKGDSLKK